MMGHLARSLRPALFLLILTGRCCLCDTDHAISRDFLVRIIGPESGPPFDTARALSISPGRSIWIGGLNGLFEYDGSTFRSINPTPDPSFVGGSGKSIVDSSGRLWVSTNAGIARLENGKWMLFSEAEGWPKTTVKSFCLGSHGSLFATHGHFIARFANGRFEPLPTPPNLHPDADLQCVVDHQGALWASWGDNASPSYPGYLARFSNGVWQQLPPPSPRPRNWLNGLARARDGAIWIADTRRAYRLDPESLAITSTRDFGRHLDGPVSIHEDSRGYLWIGDYYQGLIAFTPDGLEKLESSTQDGFLSRRVLDITEDQDGAVWVAGRGLSRLEWRSFSPFGVSAGLEESAVYSLAPRPDGSLIIAGIGLWSFKNKLFSRLLPHDGSFGPTTSFYAALTTRSGDTWLASSDNGLFRLKNQRFERLPPELFQNERIRSLFEDARSRVWVGADDGSITVLEQDKVSHTYKLPGTRPSVLQLDQDPQGAMWAGTLKGLFRSLPSSQNVLGPWESIPLFASGLDAVRALRIEPNSTVWIGLENRGLVRLKDNRPFHFRAHHGMDLTSITMIFEDSGFLYLGTPRGGILRCRKSHLNEVADGKRLRVDLQAFDASDGLGTDSQNLFFTTNPWARGSDGRLWLARSTGIVEAHLERLPDLPKPPVVSIESVVALTPGRDLTHFKPGAPIGIPADAHRVEIQTGVASLSAFNKLRFQYRLGASPKAWVDIGSVRRLGFDELAPGKYKCEIRASYNHGPWGPSSSVEFTVATSFFNRWGIPFAALVLCIGIFGLVVSLIQMQRTRQASMDLQREQTLAQESLRSRLLVERTSDLVSFATPDGKIIYMNSAGRALTGHAELPAGLSLGDLLAPESRTVFESDGYAAARRDGAWSIDGSLLHKNGNRVPAYLVLVAQDTADKQPILLALTARDSTQHKLLTDSLRDLSIKRDVVLEEERKRISREIHDDLGQQLTALKIELTFMSRATEGPFDSVLHGLDEIIRTTRRIASELRPPVLDHFGLAAAAEWQLGEFQKRTRILTSWTLDPGIITTPELSLTIFRILQESLTNAARHSGATRISVSLSSEAGFILLRVTDNGKGIDPEIVSKSRSSMGLLSLQERANSVAGCVDVRSTPGEGTTVEASFPFAPNPAPKSVGASTSA